MISEEDERSQGSMVVTLDLTPTLSYERRFEHLSEIIRGFCKPNDGDSVDISNEPIILHPYNNLKKALQNGFCDPGQFFSPSTAENDGVGSTMTRSYDSEDTKVTEPRSSKERVSIDDEEEENGEVLIVTAPGEGRGARVARALETVLFAAIFLFFTFYALRRLNADLGVEFQPKVATRSFFSIGSKFECGAVSLQPCR